MTETSTTLAVRNPAALAVMDDKIEYCKLLAESGLLPDVYRKQPANVLYAVEYGETIGIGTMAAITGVHVIKGKPTASSALIGALVRRAGHKLRVRGTEAGARAVIIRADDPEFEYVSEWTIDRAVTARLCVLKDGRPYARDTKGDPTAWEKYPAAMLKARAITEVARDACEEVLFGLHYTPEELGAQVDEDGIPVERVLEAVGRKAQRERREQPPAEDQWTDNAAALPDDAPRPSTSGQRSKLVLLVKDKRGVLDDEGQRRLLGELVGRELASRKDITFGEAHRLIDKLEAEPDHIPDAEVVDEPPASGPNPRNGDVPVSAGVEAALATPDAESAEQLRADSDELASTWYTAINEANSHRMLESIGRNISAAVQDGRLLEADRKTLEDAWRDRKKQLPAPEPIPAEQDGDGSWSHRLLDERTGAGAPA